MINLDEITLADHDPTERGLVPDVQTWYGWKAEHGYLWKATPFLEEKDHHYERPRTVHPIYSCKVIVPAVQMGDNASVTRRIIALLDERVRERKAKKTPVE